jgi:site-specific DNA-methyltransferase (adenine-specific)
LATAWTCGAFGATSGRSEEAYRDGSEIRDTLQITAPATPEAQQWAGWGTALKPALEPITMARKPLAGTVAANVLEHGTGALNVDGCRVGTESTLLTNGKTAIGVDGEMNSEQVGSAKGRWPANLIHDGSDEVVGLFPSGGAHGGKGGAGAIWGSGAAGGNDHADGSTGSAARFFYCPKASKRERGEGNIHPTVKPVELMRYLCRLVTPPGGVVLDPFMGSGSTGMACELEGFDFIGIERESEYLEIATQRIRRAQSQ